MARRDFGINIFGDKATKKILKGLSRASRNRVLRPAIRKGSSIANKAAKAHIKTLNFEDSTGALERSIGIKTGTDKRTGAFAVIGARSGISRVDSRGVTRVPFFYSHLVEGGTQPHAIGNAQHPGAKPKPFIAPTYDQNAAKIERVIQDEVRVQILRELARQRARAR